MSWQAHAKVLILTQTGGSHGYLAKLNYSCLFRTNKFPGSDEQFSDECL